MTLKPGHTLNNNQYRIIQQLGRGGYGFVYLAQDTVIDEQVAIKELIPALVGDEIVLKRFLAEAKATIRLRHERIVGTYNVFQEGDNYYIVMEYMPGGSLETRLQSQGSLPVDQAVTIIAQVCEGLSYAHRHGIVHCDLKPANILFAADDSAKVADFGIAHVSEQMLSRSWMTPAGFVAGTLPYMSPEQTDGVRDDPRVDVYALGAVLYRTLTGRTYIEFDQRDTPRAQSENVQRISSETPIPPSTINPAVPGWLDEVVLRALAKGPQDRFGSSLDLRTALIGRQVAPPVPPAPAPAPTSIVSPLPRTASPAASPTPRRTRLPAWFWPIAGLAGVLLIALVIAIAGLAGWGERKGGTATALVQMVVTVQAQRPTAPPTHLPAQPPAPSKLPTITPAQQAAATAVPTPQVTITIWNQWSGDYEKAIQAAMDSCAAPLGLKVDLSSPQDTASALEVAIPAGQGPDIIGWANDAIGKYALAGSIVDLGTYGIDQNYLTTNFEPAAVKGVVWQDKIWALPESQEAIALVYNKKLVTAKYLPTDPMNFDDLLAKATQFAADNPGKYLVCNQGLGAADPYHEAPIYFGFGVPSYVDDQGKVYLNTPEALKAAEWLVKFSKVSPKEANYDICKSGLVDGTFGMWWTGPWAISDIEKGGIDYRIIPMGKPFVGIKTLMLTKNAVDRGSAENAVKIVKCFTSADVQKTVALANRTIPTSTKAMADPDIQALYTVKQFGASAALGIPMANAPYADAQWGPVGDATQAIWTGAQTPAAALADAQTGIEKKIAEMK